MQTANRLPLVLALVFWVQFLSGCNEPLATTFAEPTQVQTDTQRPVVERTITPSPKSIPTDTVTMPTASSTFTKEPTWTATTEPTWTPVPTLPLPDQYQKY